MTSQSTANHEREASANESAGSNVLSRGKRAFGDGSAALLTGGALLVGTLRARSRERTAFQGLISLALIGIGLRQRRSGDENGLLTGSDDQADGEDVSAEAEAGATTSLHDVDQQVRGNPRDVSKDPDVDTDEDEGDIQFSREQETGPRQEPDLDEEGVRDTRQTDETDDEVDVEIDISEAAMADEPNEAAGPTSAQAQPTTTKDEDSAPEGEESPFTEDASDMRVDPDESDDESEEQERETVESEGGAEIHTDTMEAGTMDIDEDDVTDPGDDLNEESANSEEQSSSRQGDDESEDDESEKHD